MHLENITIPQEGIDWQKCLQHWAWLLKECSDFSILLVTKFGEVFVSNDNGEVWFLSTSNGSFDKVAESKEEFLDQLCDIEKLEYYFMPKVISVLNEAGMKLSEGECFGFHVPCIFEECTFDPGNFKQVQIEEYLIALGDMLYELQGMPDGGEVTFEPVV